MPRLPARLPGLWVALAGAVASLSAVGCGADSEDTACSGLLPGDLVVTEVFADHGAPSGTSGSDEGREWFEIYNATSRALELEGLTLEHGRPDAESDAIKRHVLTPLTIEPGAYVVFGNVLADLAPSYVNYGYADGLGDLYNSDSGRLGLRCGATLIDEATYVETSPGQSYALGGGSAPDYLANDASAAWCATDENATYEYLASNFGTPGAANPACEGVAIGTCLDGGTARATVPPQAGDIVITELMPNPNLSDSVGEWIEILVTRDLDLNGISLARGTGTRSTIESADCVRATAGGYVVFAKNADVAMNGGIEGVAGTFAFDLVGGSESSPGNVTVRMGDVELDAISWTSSRSKKSLQLSAGLTSPADNDVPTNLCDATVTYNDMDFGTPGIANSACGAVTTGMCMDAALGALRPIVTPTAGQLVISEWLFDTVSPLTDAVGEWIEVRATVPVDLNGLQGGVATLATTPVIPASGNCVSLAAGGYAVLSHSATGHGLPVTPVGVFGFDLPNTGARTVLIGFGGTAIDSRSWTGLTTNADDGRSTIVDSAGTQCIAPAGTAAYTTNQYGTPGSANSPECSP